MAVVGVPHECVSSGRGGARAGPGAIREASIDLAYVLQGTPDRSVVDIETGRILELPAAGRMVDLGDLAVDAIDHPTTCELLRDVMGSLVERRAVPVVLGGDRWITRPLFDAFSSALTEADGAVNTGFIRLSSALEIARPDPAGRCWLDATTSGAGVLAAERMAWIGVHGFVSYDEWEQGRRCGSLVITADSVREHGVPECRRRIGDRLGSCDAVYVSLDIGVADGLEAPGRGEIEIGALAPRLVLEMIRALADLEVRAVDVVEVAPQWDPFGRTQRLAAEALVELLAPRFRSS